MYFNPFVTQLLAEERMKDIMHQAEQARLIRAVKGSGKSWRWRLPIIWERHAPSHVCKCKQMTKA